MSNDFRADEITLGTAQVKLQQGAGDPSTGGGSAAPVGSAYFRGTGTPGVYNKTGAGNTAWLKVPQGVFFNVLDYGATGDGVTDDRAAIQLAINDAAVIGGCVFFPPGTYAVGRNGNPYSFDINGLSNICFMGVGYGGAVIKQTGDAAAGAWAIFRVRGGAQRIVFDRLGFDQAGVTNPSTSVHCILVGDGATGATDIKVLDCRFLGLAGCGDQVRFIGAAGNLISRFWVAEHCMFDSAARHGVSINEFCEKGWVVGNELRSAGTNEINITASVAASIDLIKVAENRIEHSAANGIAVSWSGDATNRINRSHFVHNDVISGNCTFTGLKRCQIQSNQILSGVYAAYTDAVVKLSGANSESQIQKNIIQRQNGMGVGYVVEIIDDGTNVPQKIQCQDNTFVQEVQAAGLVHVRSANTFQLGPNISQVTDAGGTTAIAILVDGVAAGAVDKGSVVGNNVSAAAGTWLYGIKLFSNGGNVVDVLCAGNVLNNVDTGVRLEGTGGGAGGFTGKIAIMSSDLNGATTDWSKTGTTITPCIAGNCSTFGAQVLSDAGTPEAAVTARIGSLFLRRDGGAGTTLYVKESTTGNTGWIGK